MALWDSVKKGAEEGLEALREGMAVFMAEAGKQSRIFRKKVELTTLQNNVRHTFTRLGGRVYDLHVRGEKDILSHPEVKVLIDQTDGYRARVREIEAEIEAIRKEEAPPPSPPDSEKPPAPSPPPESWM
jgi:hypothetical protein